MQPFPSAHCLPSHPKTNPIRLFLSAYFRHPSFPLLRGLSTQPLTGASPCLCSHSSPGPIEFPALTPPSLCRPSCRPQSLRILANAANRFRCSAVRTTPLGALPLQPIQCGAAPSGPVPAPAANVFRPSPVVPIPIVNHCSLSNPALSKPLAASAANRLDSVAVTPLRLLGSHRKHDLSTRLAYGPMQPVNVQSCPATFAAHPLLVLCGRSSPRIAYRNLSTVCMRSQRHPIHYARRDWLLFLYSPSIRSHCRSLPTTPVAVLVQPILPKLLGAPQVLTVPVDSCAIPVLRSRSKRPRDPITAFHFQCSRSCRIPVTTSPHYAYPLRPVHCYQLLHYRVVTPAAAAAPPGGFSSIPALRSHSTRSTFLSLPAPSYLMQPVLSSHALARSCPRVSSADSPVRSRNLLTTRILCSCSARCPIAANGTSRRQLRPSLFGFLRRFLHCP